MEGERGYRAAVGGAVAMSVLLRLRFVFAPIGSDEGGYLAVARAWRHGADVYRDVWVDRPQGLLLLYRAYDMLIGDEDLVRLLALVFGAVAVAATAVAVRTVAGRRSSVMAAWCVAMMSASPAIEGYAANGELLSAAMSAVAVACGVAVLADRRPDRWMLLAGFFGAAGWSVKQSGVDGFGAVALALLVL